MSFNCHTVNSTCYHIILWCSKTFVDVGDNSSIATVYVIRFKLWHKSLYIFFENTYACPNSGDIEISILCVVHGIDFRLWGACHAYSSIALSFSEKSRTKVVFRCKKCQRIKKIRLNESCWANEKEKCHLIWKWPLFKFNGLTWLHLLALCILFFCLFWVWKHFLKMDTSHYIH